MDISVVIPNWNGKKLLKECLESLSQQSLKDFEIIVVDNGSTDGSIEFLRKYYPKIKIIELEKNFGFARAVNEGIKVSDSKYVVLLNNDTRTEKNYLQKMVNALKNKPRICGIAPKILNFSNPQVIDSAGDIMNVAGQAFHRGHREKNAKWNTPGEVFLVTAGAGMFRRGIFKKIGFFDEDYFAYGEDVDLCFRAQLIGCKFWYEPKAIVYHKHKATGRRIPKKVEYLQFRNMTLTILKDFPWRLFLKRWRFLTIPLVHLNTIFYMATRGLIKEALLADFWIFTSLLKVIRKRRQVQKTRKVSIDYLDKQMGPKKIRLYGILK